MVILDEEHSLVLEQTPDELVADHEKLVLHEVHGVSARRSGRRLRARPRSAAPRDASGDGKDEPPSARLSISMFPMSRTTRQKTCVSRFGSGTAAPGQRSLRVHWQAGGEDAC